MSILTGLSGVLRGNDQEYPYECRGCHRQFTVEYYTCPHCGSFSVDPRL